MKIKDIKLTSRKMLIDLFTVKDEVYTAVELSKLMNLERSTITKRVRRLMTEKKVSRLIATRNHSVWYGCKEALKEAQKKLGGIIE